MTIDQTASERVLHRVIWTIKLMRATVLHICLAVLGAIIYFAAGIDAYPVVTAYIQAERARAISQGLHEETSVAVGFALGSVIALGTVLAWLVRMYRDLTSVNRRALRLHAGGMLIFAAISMRSGVANLPFAFRELPTAFVVLVVASLLMTTVFVPLSVALALFRVSRLDDRSSFVATLDARLAPTWPAYAAKLLDLPRTPLRTPRTLAAFTLAGAGALLMIASLLYLVTFGGAQNKLQVLALAARNDLLAQAASVASGEALRIWLVLPFAVVGVKAAALLQSLAKRIGGLGLSDAVKNPEDRFILYLRPFGLDQVILPTPRLTWWNRLYSFRPYPVRVEEELFDVADGYLPLIAIGKPGTAGQARGGLAYRTFLADADWQAFAADRIRRAHRIVMVVEETRGVRWEIDQVLTGGAVGKTLFFFQPTVSYAPGLTSVHRMMAEALTHAGVVDPDFEFVSRPLGFYIDDGRVVEIVNHNWTATSYRTAFSHFLTESHARLVQR